MTPVHGIPARPVEPASSTPRLHQEAAQSQAQGAAAVAEDRVVVSRQARQLAALDQLATPELQLSPRQLREMVSPKTDPATTPSD